MATHTIRFPHEREVSSDPEVQEALERICVETTDTYWLVSWLWRLVPDVLAVRRLCELKAVMNMSDHQVIHTARVIRDYAERFKLDPAALLEAVWAVTDGLTAVGAPVLAQRLLRLGKV